MRYIILNISFMILFIACGNIIKKKNEIDLSNSIVKEQIDDGLLKGFEKFREWRKNDQCNITDSNICYLVKFSQEKELLNIAVPHDSNPVVVISYNECSLNYAGYKGVLKANGYYIAIFDSDDIGSHFYDQSAFVDMNISDFECFNNKLKYMSLFKIRGDSIIPSPPLSEGAYP